jgi:antitoxin VapB
MGMQLNIKSDEAYRLAARLAELTGQSMTMAVTDALRQRVIAEEKARDSEAMVKDILAIAADIRAHMLERGPLPSSDLNFLYDDETGLPI